MSRETSFYIVDIFIATDKIQRYTEKFTDAKSFLYSELEWDATIRELEIIGEATGKLLKQNILSEEYQQIVSFRNHIVHGYFGIDETIVWEVVHSLLHEFIDNLSVLIRKKNIDITFAIQSAIEDYRHHPKTVDFLQKLYHKWQ